MIDKDYYAILGVEERATSEEIKSAYRKLALKYHPDRAQSTEKKTAEERFKEITAAYYVLGDSQRRREYDDYRKGVRAFGGASARDFASQSGFNFEDLMKHFQDSGQTRHRRPGGFGKYFSFQDLSDIFQGFDFGSSNSEDGYTAYQFQHEPSREKYDTNIYATLDIPFHIAQHGGQTRFTLSNGRIISLNVNAGTKNGQKMRLKGLGELCPSCDHRGDLILTIHYRSL